MFRASWTRVNGHSGVAEEDLVRFLGFHDRRRDQVQLAVVPNDGRDGADREDAIRHHNPRGRFVHEDVHRQVGAQGRYTGPALGTQKND